MRSLGFGPIDRSFGEHLGVTLRPFWCVTVPATLRNLMGRAACELAKSGRLRIPTHADQ